MLSPASTLVAPQPAYSVRARLSARLQAMMTSCAVLDDQEQVGHANDALNIF